MANREDIVTSSLRNRTLCRQLAAVFIAAVKQMCEHPQLKFKWMKYLPSLTGSPSDDPFWGTLVDELKSSISDADIMVPRAQPSNLRPINQLQRMTARSFDRHGNPVFADLKGRDAIYLSPDYDATDLDILEGYGLQWIYVDNLIRRAAADLGSPLSRMRAVDTDSDWHSRAATLLLSPFNSPAAKWYIPKVKALSLVPLRTGEWVTTVNHAVHFPTTLEDLGIPQGLGLQLIDPQAASHPTRKELFLALGATVPSAADIRARILKSLGQQGQANSVNKDTSIALLRFLYLTHPKDAPADVYSQFRLLDTAMEPCVPHQDDLYLKDDTSSYGPAKLGLAVKYLHPDYLHDPPVRSGGEAVFKQSWRSWLYQFLGIRKRLRLACEDAAGKLALSKEALYVAEHLPTKFLGLLRFLWPHEDAKVTSCSSLHVDLMCTNVLCEDDEMEYLQYTVLPLPHLKQLSARYLLPGEGIDFLMLETQLADTDLAGWDFLDLCHVIRSEGLPLYLKMLQSIATSTRENCLQEASRVLKLYAAIYGQCITSDNAKDARELARYTI